jgi:hypothetical protein
VVWGFASFSRVSHYYFHPFEDVHLVVLRLESSENRLTLCIIRESL